MCDGYGQLGRGLQARLLHVVETMAAAEEQRPQFQFDKQLCCSAKKWVMPSYLVPICISAESTVDVALTLQPDQLEGVNLVAKMNALVSPGDDRWSFSCRRQHERSEVFNRCA